MTYRKSTRKFSPSTGINRQREAITLEEAQAALEYSCRLCGGSYNIPCDKCPVARAYKDKIDTIKLLREAEELSRQQKQREVARLKELEDEALNIYLTVRSCRDILEHEDELQALTDKFLRYKDGKVIRG